MGPGAVVALTGGGVVVLLLYRRSHPPTPPPGLFSGSPELAALARGRSRALAGGGVAVTPGRPEPLDTGAFGRGVPLMPAPTPPDVLAPADPVALFSATGGGDGGLSIATPTGIPGNVAPSDFSYAQFAAAVVGPQQPGTQAIVALGSGNLLGFVGAVVDGLVSLFGGVPADVSTGASLAATGGKVGQAAATAGQAIAEGNPVAAVVSLAGAAVNAGSSGGKSFGQAAASIVGQVLGLLGVSIPGPGPIPGAVVAGARFAAGKAVDVAQANLSLVELDIVNDLVAAMRADPTLISELAYPSVTAIAAPPGTHSIPGQANFFTDFTLVPVDITGRPYGAGTGNPAPNSTNFGDSPANTSQPDVNQPSLPATVDPTPDVAFPSIAPPTIEVEDGEVEGGVVGTGPTGPGVASGSGEAGIGTAGVGSSSGPGVASGSGEAGIGDAGVGSGGPGGGDGSSSGSDGGDGGGVGSGDGAGAAGTGDGGASGVGGDGGVGTGAGD